MTATVAQAAHEKEIAEFGQDGEFWLFGYGSLIWKPPPHYDQRIPGYIEGYVRRFWQASEDHRGTPEAPGRVVTLIDRAHWETLTDHHTSTERVWGAAYHIPSSHVASVRAYLDIREINGYSIQFTPFHPAPYTVSISSPPATPEPTATTPNKPPTLPSPSMSTGTGTGTTPSNHRSSLSITAHTTLSLYPSNSPNAPIKCLVYIGLPSNAQFLGPQDPEELAKHILKSRGPSGENKEYLYALERSLLGLGKDSEDRHVSDLVRRCRRLEVEEVGETESGANSGEEGVGTEETGEKADVGEILRRVGSTEEQEEVEK